ncbi:MAG TPA: DUF2510 domain-containing protein [Propionibacteriaceae bacterium]|nr:DUF2510 domain-containing protein [Propionibacteriaceae bacterium]
MTAPRPGWYPDPAGAAGLYRWWDGQHWTLAMSEFARAPAPLGHPSATAAVSGSTVPELDGGDSDDWPRRRSPLRTAIAITLGFALFVSAGLGLSVAIWNDQPSADPTGEAAPLTGPSTARGSSLTSSPSGDLDHATRVATINQASIRLPDVPYEPYPNAMARSGTFDVMFVAEAMVHRRYDGRQNWTATVALSALAPAIGANRDLEGTGRAALSAFVAAFFSSAKVSDLSSWQWSVDGHPGVMLTARASYSVKHLASSYDDITVAVVRLEDGTRIAAISSVPDDADAQVRRLAGASMDSLTIS